MYNAPNRSRLNPLLRALSPCLAAAVLLSAAPALHVGADGATLGYSPANMDKRVSPRQDFYCYAAGKWLARAEIPPSEPEISGFTELAITLEQQLLKPLKDSAAAKVAPCSGRQKFAARRGASPVAG